MARDDGRDGADSRGHTRRAILAATAAGGAAGLASALSDSGTPGNLWGGTMALSKAYNVSGELWIGPDSAKSNVDATDGRVYMASDTQVEYYGDGGTWTKLGIGSASQPIPSVHTDALNNTHYVRTDDDGQAVINAATAGDTVVFKRGTHKPTSPYTVDKPLVIKGDSTSVTGTTPNPDSNIDDWDGATIEQQTAGEHVFQTSGISGEQVDFKNLLLTWESSIRDSDTGDAIHADAPDDADASAKQSGLFGTTIENVWVHGNDGDSYGLYSANPQHLTINHFKVIGGGGIHLEQNHDNTNYGNTLIMGFFCNLQNDGSAHGIYLHSISGLLNLLTWIRPQVNTNISSGTGQQHLRIHEDGGTVDSQTYVGVNMEENNGNGGIDRPQGNATWLRARIGSAISIQNSVTDVIDPAGDVLIRDDFIRAKNIEATNAYYLQNDDGTNPRVIQYNQANDHVQFKHSNAGTNIQLYGGGLIGFINGQGLVFSINGTSIECRGNPLTGVDRVEGQSVKSSPPSSPSAGDWYIDDGTNTSSGNVAMRIYDGSAWVDQN